jgi:hypothetical protein
MSSLHKLDSSSLASALVDLELEAPSSRKLRAPVWKYIYNSTKKENQAHFYYIYYNKKTRKLYYISLLENIKKYI